MDMDEYQREAEKTDQITSQSDELAKIMMPILGLGDEAGSVFTEYKKWLVNGDYYRVFNSRIAEELGDVLWYLSNLASKLDLSLNEIAANNLQKTQSRFQVPRDKTDSPVVLFDEEFPGDQRLPREFQIEFVHDSSGDPNRVYMYWQGSMLGDPIDDNSRYDDGYRFHDIFHIAYATYLGWSPVLRKLMGRKRKADSAIDRNEDGARARIIEEAISAIVFQYASQYNYFKSGSAVDNSTLRNIATLVSHLEVKKQPPSQWERAIIEGFRVWRDVCDKTRVVVCADLKNQNLTWYEPGT